MGRRLVIAAAVVVALAGLAFALWRPDLAPHARAQAAAAWDDPVWDAPLAEHPRRSWTSLARPDWLWNTTDHGPRTTVGRHYAPDSTFEDWTAVVEQAGWLRHGGGTTAAGPEITFTKQVGRWPAVLTVRRTTIGPGAMTVSIALPVGS